MKLEPIARHWHTDYVKTTTLRLSEDLYARVERQAERDHRSVNAQMVYILERATDTDEQDH